MAQRATTTDLEFLRRLDAWIARGLPAYSFAEQEGIAAGTITYRVRTYGLLCKRAVGLVDVRTGRSFQELLDAGEIVVAEPAGVAA
ncbi:MAG TPA: hypothetical protein VFU47_03875 [Armatimonadota bacterium]|nr:hypothetical protein [Armatimonadota bacterium]